MSALRVEKVFAEPKPEIHRLAYISIPMADDTFLPCRSYYKSELAKEYNVSLKTFMRWLNRMDTDLKQVGYNAHCKIMAPKIVQVIFDNLGTP